MESDDFLELVRNRRSIHWFKPDPVPDDCVEKILEATRWAMSGPNGQPWEFIVVRDQDTKKKIGEIYLDHRRRLYTIETTRVEELRHQGFIDPPTAASARLSFDDAPVLIVVCGDPRTFLATVVSAHLYQGDGGPNGTYISNLANATFMLQLAAAAYGLGSQWCSVERVWERKVRAILEVPDELEIHSIVPIGYPALQQQNPYRRELKELVHYEKYDRSRLRTDEDFIEYLRDLRQRMKARPGL